ncbi:DUF58 domain-containing protein [Halobacteriales archaeon QS_8_69_73]|nr:MAG: DUF58 domain-containing protein [Halobacteriales archaeon QS_8_69_73]
MYGYATDADRPGGRLADAVDRGRRRGFRPSGAAGRDGGARRVARRLRVPRVIVDDDVEVTLRGSAVETDATVTVRLRLPPTLVTDAPDERTTISLLGDVPTETTVAVSAPVAGDVTVPQPQVTVADGLFEETFARGPSRSLTVVPRRPDDLNVGSADSSTLEGSYSSERRTRGTEPAEVRRYVPGETADNIDWNATARLPDIYVREFEVESALETAFVLDARASTRVGADGERALDYLREVALGLVGLSRAREDPVGLAVVDDDGVAGVRSPTNRPTRYERLERRLRSLEADGGRHRPPGRVDGGEPVAARLATVDVQGPFLETLSTCVERRTALPADHSPLRAAAGVGSADRTVLLTDDANRRELRDAVEAARYRSSQVVVFLAPRVLFEPGALGDLSAAYERYVAFESFRRSLDGLDGVSVFEVNPGNRSRRLRSEAIERSA